MHNEHDGRSAWSEDPARDVVPALGDPPGRGMPWRPAPTGETELGMVLRHVEQGRRTLARQRAVVERARQKGHGVARSERLLASFEAMHEEHLRHLERLEKGR